MLKRCLPAAFESMMSTSASPEDFLIHAINTFIIVNQHHYQLSNMLAHYQLNNMLAHYQLSNMLAQYQLSNMLACNIQQYILQEELLCVVRMPFPICHHVHLFLVISHSVIIFSYFLPRSQLYLHLHLLRDSTSTFFLQSVHEPYHIQ
jgi:hypothetical protein